MFHSLIAVVNAQQQPQYPPGCTGPTFPDEKICLARDWDMGADYKDKCAPYGDYPVVGQQVYIQDQNNFCMNLPDPNNPTLKEEYYNRGRKPTIVSAEGFVQSFCVGSYLSPGAAKMPSGAITSAHVVKAISPNGKKYWQISGTMDCGVLGLNCQGDNGGQYDSVSARYCGKEPYSGTDAQRHPGQPDYIMQAGDGIFCMRVCDPGQQLTDPCNVKNDTAGCTATMGVDFPPGFSFVDLTGSKPVTSTLITTTTTEVPSTTASATSTPTTTTKASDALSLSATFAGLALFLLLL